MKKGQLRTLVRQLVAGIKRLSDDRDQNELVAAPPLLPHTPSRTLHIPPTTTTTTTTAIINNDKDIIDRISNHPSKSPTNDPTTTTISISQHVNGSSVVGVKNVNVNVNNVNNVNVNANDNADNYFATTHACISRGILTRQPVVVCVHSFNDVSTESLSYASFSLSSPLCVSLSFHHSPHLCSLPLPFPSPLPLRLPLPPLPLCSLPAPAPTFFHLPHIPLHLPIPPPIPSLPESESDRMINTINMLTSILPRRSYTLPFS